PLKKHPLPYTIEYIGLFPGWDTLKEKIHIRLESRIKEGMVEEVEHLHKKENISWKRLESFGLEYKYIALYLQDKLSYEEMKNSLEMAIFHYAKRQMTWFKRNKQIKWY
ncbi:MAG: tRNA dimethylallyltransferase, partial [Patescibacteria group bacterium]